jgi:hypothetical protein
VSPDTPAAAVPTVDSTIGELHLLPMMLNTAAHCVMTPLLLPATPASSDVSCERMLLLSGASGSGGYDSSSMLLPMIVTWSLGRVTLVKASVSMTLMCPTPRLLSGPLLLLLPLAGSPETGTPEASPPAAVITGTIPTAMGSCVPLTTHTGTDKLSVSGLPWARACP